MKQYIVAAGVGLIVLLLAISFIKPVQQVTQTLGAVPVLSSPLSIEGIDTYYFSTKMRSASSTPCAFKSPNATTTVVYAAVRVASTSASTVVVEIGSATTPYATTTRLAYGSLSANKYGTLVASTTSNGIKFDSQTVISPNRYIVTKVGGPAVGRSQLGGSCALMLRTY